MSERFAIYFAPEPGSTLATFGDRWLGRDAASGVPVPQPDLADIPPARLAEITAAPRQYGFHATLKAPFALASGFTVEALQAAAEAFAARQLSFLAPSLVLTSLDGFLALTLSEPCPRMDRLATACVVHFDRFRAPPSPDELARRRPDRLDARQRELLDRWGYPHVLDAFRFHMTLTDRLAEPERESVRAALRPLVAEAAAAPLAVDGVAIFGQRQRDAPFHLLSRHRFPCKAADAAATVLRPLAERDLAAAKALHALAFETLAAHHHLPAQLAAHTKLTQAPDYETDLRRSNLMLALDPQGGVVATAGWLAVTDEPGTARIRKVFVHPAMARSGLATRLVLDAERRARAAGHRRLIVRANINAVPLYEKLGYRPLRAGTMPAADSVGLPVVFMEKAGEGSASR